MLLGQPAYYVGFASLNAFFAKKMYHFSQHNVMNDWSPNASEGVEIEVHRSSWRY
jgi:hypothetical protein